MSDEMPTDRDGIAEAITADLTAMDTAATPPAPEVEAAAVEVAPENTPPAETPAPAADAPTPLVLTDKSIVEDPANPGEFKSWGEIKADRLRHADYTKKTMALAERQREFDAAEARRQAAFDAWKAQQEAAKMPDLPEDDPYAQRIRAIEAQAKYLAEVDAQRQRAHEEQMEQTKLESRRAALDAEEKRLTDQYKFEQREMDIVEAEFYRRGKAGENVTLEAVAKDYRSYLDAKEEAAVARWKEKNRVSAPAATISVPAAGTTDSIPVPGSRGFLDAIREEVGALMR